MVDHWVCLPRHRSLAGSGLLPERPQIVTIKRLPTAYAGSTVGCGCRLLKRLSRRRSNHAALCRRDARGQDAGAVDRLRIDEVTRVSAFSRPVGPRLSACQ